MVGNRGATYATGDTFVVTALDDQVEFGGFTLALEDVQLTTCINERLSYLTDNGNIGYREWLQNREIFLTRAEMWNAEKR